MEHATVEEQAKSKRLTNLELVTEIMEFSRSGALAQVFVIDAIYKHATAVAKAEAAEVDHALISDHAWIQCAREIKARMDAHHGKSGTD